ncbi:hypothetical protein [Methylobacterium adhaesivum]|uniref:Rad50/SbcC-type AAA domain-containing protein n=1 Tax=Methylobacterium adhaesivum TaxID=333297 RepID=A0ABT8BIZ6_9HYPH|nr:hypothetical protein [Methylobacterium adhaesivum]MDN3591655.1 hypothetical protein [Methylobacterium adhaesivum]
MILSLTSDLPGFKGLTFHEGLNVVLADRTDASTERQTRNSAGKTSVIEVMHFLLGSAAGKSSIFQSPALSRSRSTPDSGSVIMKSPCRAAVPTQTGYFSWRRMPPRSPPR